jgi:hypothetical protein
MSFSGRGRRFGRLDGDVISPSLLGPNKIFGSRSQPCLGELSPAQRDVPERRLRTGLLEDPG